MIDYTIPAKFGQIRSGVIDPMTLANLREQVETRRIAAAKLQAEHDKAVAVEQQMNLLGQLIPQAITVDESGQPNVNLPVAQQVAQIGGKDGINAMREYMQALTPPAMPGQVSGQQVPNYVGPESIDPATGKSRFGTLMMYPGGKREFLPQREPVKDTSKQDQQGRQFLINTELKLADDYRAESKDYATVSRQYSIIKKSLDNPSAVGTLAAATAVMKMLDPGSVVRESELGMAMNATGAMDRFQNYLNVIESGKVLTEDQKKEFSSLTDQFFNAYKEYQSNINDKYMQRAQNYGLNPKNIITFDIALPGDVPMSSRGSAGKIAPVGAKGKKVDLSKLVPVR